MPGLCPATVGTRLVKGVPQKHADDFRPWAKRHALPYGRPAWLVGRAAAILALQRGGVLVDTQGLGCGSFGCAYPVEGRPDLVVKITGDSSEAAAANAVIAARNRGAVFPGLVRFHCVYAVRETKVFAILQERLRPLPRADRNWINTHGDDVIDAAGQRAQSAAEWGARIGGSLRRKDVEGLIVTLRALWDQAGVRWLDLHGGNVLTDPRTGAWRIIDLGISQVHPAQRVARLDGLAGIVAGRIGGHV